MFSVVVMNVIIGMLVWFCNRKEREPLYSHSTERSIGTTLLGVDRLVDFLTIHINSISWNDASNDVRLMTSVSVSMRKTLMPCGFSWFGVTRQFRPPAVLQITSVSHWPAVDLWLKRTCQSTLLMSVTPWAAASHFILTASFGQFWETAADPEGRCNRFLR